MPLLSLRNSVFASIRGFIDALVHPSARQDPLTAARHRAFFAVKIFSGFSVLALLPLYLASRGTAGALEVTALLWALAPFLLAVYLSRSGQFERAHLLSAFALAGLVATLAVMTGGAASFAAPWVVVIALEASLSASRRLIVATISLAALTAFGLFTASANGWLAAYTAADLDLPALTLAGTLSAAVYAGMIALANSAFVRTGNEVRRLSEARYKLLAQNMSDVIARHAVDGAVTFISPAIEQLAGVPAAQLLGHKLFERVHIADRPAYLTALSDASRSNEPASVEFRLLCETSAAPVFAWVEMRARAIDGQAQQVVSVMRDISARKADALAVEQARNEAEKANDAKSKFLATVSHELRTPLNAIIGFSEMLAREQEMKLDLARRGEYASLIRDSGEHLLSVVNGILDMSRIEAGHFEIVAEPFSVRPLIESCRKMMSLRAEQAGVQLFTDLPDQLPELSADPRALRQVVINLVSNAIKFTERGGKIDLAARANGDQFELIVTDNGIGIPEADLARLGDPFFQGRSTYDRMYEGTGLGLSVVMGLVKLHGGSVHIESRLQKGTRVTVRMPLDCQPAAAVAGKNSVTKFPARNSAAADASRGMKKSA
ncbi:MAG TPA: ATP-binding protein [Xanthobacteraceae bacterium]|nr:ATP-binding protein [Xanthobacteraceae bacterium]